MKGCNEIKLCSAEMMTALQEWLDKRMPDNDSDVTEVTQTSVGVDNTFTIKLRSGKDS